MDLSPLTKFCKVVLSKEHVFMGFLVLLQVNKHMHKKETSYRPTQSTFHAFMQRLSYTWWENVQSTTMCAQ